MHLAFWLGCVVYLLFLFFFILLDILSTIYYMVFPNPTLSISTIAEIPDSADKKSVDDLLAEAINKPIYRQQFERVRSYAERDYSDIKTKTEVLKNPSVEAYMKCIEVLETSSLPKAFHTHYERTANLDEAYRLAKLQVFMERHLLTVNLTTKNISQEQKDFITSMHLAYLHTEISGDTLSLDIFPQALSSDFSIFRCALLRQNTEYGSENPDKFEKILSHIRHNREMNRERRINLQRSNNFSDIEAKYFESRTLMEVKNARDSRYGARAEIISYLMFENVIQHDQNIERKCKELGITNLRVVQASSTADALGYADFVLMGDVPSNKDLPLVLIDVKKSEFKQDANDYWGRIGLLRAALLAGRINSETFDKEYAKAYDKASEGDQIELFVTLAHRKNSKNSKTSGFTFTLETDGDESTKEFPNTDAMSKYGISGISIRIPSLWVSESPDFDFGSVGAPKRKDLLGIISGGYERTSENTFKARPGYTIPTVSDIILPEQDSSLLSYSIVAALKNRLENLERR